MRLGLELLGEKRPVIREMLMVLRHLRLRTVCIRRSASN